MELAIKPEPRTELKTDLREEIITRSNMDIIGDDIVKEHCYVRSNAKKVFYYHLSDHNYFNHRRALKQNAQQKNKTDLQKLKQKPSKTRKRNIKITELRAVYNCKACGYRTMNREIFPNHKCEREPIFKPCTDCDKNLTPEGYQRCHECTYFTKNKSSLKVHMRIHAKGTPYKCTECECSFKDLKDLILHYDEVKDLKCDCGYATHVKQQMVTHKRTHTGEKPFCCGVCSFSTSERSTLHRHLKTHDRI